MKKKLTGLMIFIVLIYTFVAGKDAMDVYAKDIVIVLDAGHGGGDPGAIGYYGDYEKTYNLKLATYCKEELEKYDGIQVIMTRTKDKYLTLSQRSDIAVKNKADMFISFHNNAVENSSTSGSLIYVTQSNYKNMKDKSAALASGILNNFEALGLKNRGVLTRNNTLGETYSFGGSADYYAVISGCVSNKIPAMIIEHAFVTSKSDTDKFLNNSEKLKQMGLASAKAIIQYYGLGVGKEYAENVEFTTSNVSMYTGANTTLQPVFTPESVKQNTLTWSTSDKKVATVDAKGKVTAVAQGQAIITAKTVNGHYAFCKVVVKQNPQRLTINHANMKINIGESGRDIISAWMEPDIVENSTLQYTSSNTNIVTVSQYGEVTGKALGTAEVTVTSSNGIVLKCNVTVVNETISMSAKRSVIKLSTGYQVAVKDLFGISVVPSDSTTPWQVTSSNTDVAQITDDNKIKVIGNGYTLVKVATETGCSLYCLVIVEDGITGYRDVTGEQMKTIYAGEQTALSSWNMESPIYLSGSGVTFASKKIKATKDGYAIILDNGIYYLIQSKTPAVTKLQLKEASVDLLAGEKYTAKADITVENNASANLNWISSNKNVATVDEKGVITAVGTGSCVVFVQSADANAKRDSIIVNVKTAATKIKLCKSKLTVAVGYKKQLVATIAPAHATNQALTWSSSNPTVAKVGVAGLLKAKKKGTAVITAKNADGIVGSCVVTVKPKVKGITLKKRTAQNQTMLYLQKGKTTKIKAKVKPAKAVQSVYYYSTNEKVATVTSKGVVTAKKKGDAIIVICSKDGTMKEQISVIVTAKKKNATNIKIKKAKITVKVGKTATLSTVVSPVSATGNLKFTSSKKKIASVDNFGVITAKKKGTTTITVKTENGKMVKCKVTVKK